MSIISRLFDRSRAISVILVVLIATALPHEAWGQTARDYQGRWAVQFDGRPLMIVEVNVAASEPERLSGVLLRPEHFTLIGGEAVQNVEMPVVAYPIANLRFEGGGLSFAVTSNGETQNYTLTMKTGADASLQIVGTPFEPLDAVRVGGDAAIPTDWQAEVVYRISTEKTESSREMAEIYAADQESRPPATARGVMAAEAEAQFGDWKEAANQRRAQVLRLLATGELRSGVDYERAAFIFQHGETSQDYLLAHTLALVALAKGHWQAKWIAAATLDRYLLSIGQSQVYGTQLLDAAAVPLIAEANIRQLSTHTDANSISDNLRRELGVPSRANSDVRLREGERR